MKISKKKKKKLALLKPFFYVPFLCSKLFTHFPCYWMLLGFLLCAGLWSEQFAYIIQLILPNSFAKILLLNTISKQIVKHGLTFFSASPQGGASWRVHPPDVRTHLLKAPDGHSSQVNIRLPEGVTLKALHSLSPNYFYNLIFHYSSYQHSYASLTRY